MVNVQEHTPLVQVPWPLQPLGQEPGHEVRSSRKNTADRRTDLRNGETILAVAGGAREAVHTSEPNARASILMNQRVSVRTSIRENEGGRMQWGAYGDVDGHGRVHGDITSEVRAESGEIILLDVNVAVGARGRLGEREAEARGACGHSDVVVLPLELGERIGDHLAEGHLSVGWRP